MKNLGRRNFNKPFCNILQTSTSTGTGAIVFSLKCTSQIGLVSLWIGAEAAKNTENMYVHICHIWVQYAVYTVLFSIYTKKKKLWEVLKLLKAKCSRKQNSQAISRTQESWFEVHPYFCIDCAVVANMAIVNLVISRPERSVAPLSRRSTVHSAKLRKWQCSKIQNLIQWLFLVPLKGGRDYITPQKAIYKWYIRGIYCQLGDYMLPTTLYRNLKNPLTHGKECRTDSTRTCGSESEDQEFLWISQRFNGSTSQMCVLFFIMLYLK